MERESDTIQAKAYSNMPAVTLTVNGKSYGQGINSKTAFGYGKMYV